MDFSHFDYANIGFFLAFLGLLVKDILFLRLLLLSSHSTLFTVGLVNHIESMIFWHAIFILINSGRTALLFWERRKIQLPGELESLYQEFFQGFTRKEVTHLWNLGTELRLDRGLVIHQGQSPERMYFLIEGNCRVHRDGVHVSTLHRGRIFGEMSFITGQGAAADVEVGEPVRCHAWPYDALKALQPKHPGLWMKLQGLLGKDLVQKVYEHHLNLR